MSGTVGHDGEVGETAEIVLRRANPAIAGTGRGLPGAKPNCGLKPGNWPAGRSDNKEERT